METPAPGFQGSGNTIIPLLPSQTGHTGEWRSTSADSSCLQQVVLAPSTTGSLLPVPGGACACAAAFFEDGRKLTDQKFSLEATVSSLKQITSYSFQRSVGGKHKVTGKFFCRGRLAPVPQPPSWAKGRGAGVEGGGKQWGPVLDWDG